MFNLKTVKLEDNMSCPQCGHEIIAGCCLLVDEYRKEFLCGYCLEEYKDSVISEEGEDGRLLK